MLVLRSQLFEYSRDKVYTHVYTTAVSGTFLSNKKVRKNRFLPTETPDRNGRFEALWLVGTQFRR